MSAIQKRIIRELYKGTTLSLKNMFPKLRCSNISREIRRSFEIPFGIILDRKQINWSDEFSSGYYFEYSLNPKDYERVRELFLELVMNLDVKQIEFFDPQVVIEID